MRETEGNPEDISISTFQSNLEQKYAHRHPIVKDNLRNLINLLNKNVDETMMLNPDLVKALEKEADGYIDGDSSMALDRLLALLIKE